MAAVIEPTICPGCGVLPKEGGGPCDTCDATGEPLRAVKQPGTGFWVGVRATFTCNACRFDSPLNHFEMDDGVLCTRCGLEQKYEEHQWRELVRLAHEVGDFGPAGRQGRFPDETTEVDHPFPQLGRKKSWESRGRFQATPGNPLCSDCQQPLVFVGRQEGETEVRCSGCSTTRRYEFPETAGRMKHLVGVVADELAAGATEAVFKEASGVLALACPGCGAPLKDVKDAEGIHVCGFCGVTCRISTQSHARAGHQDTPVKTWWLYFDAPSKERNKRLNEARQQQARAAKKRKQAEAPPTPATAKAPKVDAGKRTELKAVLPLIGVLLTAPVLALIILKPWEAKPDKNAEAAAAEARMVEGLKTFTFDMTQDEFPGHFGLVDPRATGMKVGPKGLYRGFSFYRGGTPTYSLRIRAGYDFPPPGTARRFAEVLPHIGDAPKHFTHVHSLTALEFGHDGVKVRTWQKDKAEARKLGNAFWAVARYGLFGGTPPDAATRALVIGPKLSEAAKLDLAIPVDGARKMVTSVFPYARCASVRTPERSEVRCEVDITDRHVDKLVLAWPNAPEAHVDRAFFEYAGKGAEVQASRSSLLQCLTKALGPGKTVVTDHGSGAGYPVFSVGKERSGTLRLMKYQLVVGAADAKAKAADGESPDAKAADGKAKAADGKAPDDKAKAPDDKAPAWLGVFPTAVAALAPCE